MTSAKEDRDAIKGLHSVSSHLGKGSPYVTACDLFCFDLNSTSRSSSRWKNEPTIIQTPTNRCPPPGFRMTSNPFSANPNDFGKQTRGNKKVGNVTARQTIASGNKEYEGRPAKKPKFDHTFGDPALSKASARKIIIGHRDRPPLAPETVDVDEIESSEDERKRRRNFQNRESTDELNLKSRSESNVNVQRSRYSFPVNDIAPDGAATVVNEGLYGGSHSPGHDSITAYTSEPESGFVKGRVALYEGLPKIDLAEKARGNKAKNMQRKHNKNPLKNGASKLLQRPTPINLDPVASSSTTRQTVNQRNETELQLPIKEGYFESQYRPQQGDRTLALCWNANRFTVKINEVEIFTRTPREWEGWENTYSTSPFVIQLRGKGGIQVSIKFDDTSHAWKERSFVKLRNFLSNNGVLSSVSNHGDKLWEMAQRDHERMGPSRGYRVIVQGSGDKISTSKQQSANVASLRSRPDSSKLMSSDPAPRRTRSTMDQTAEASYLRRSARAVVPQTTTPAPDQDEVILVYPQGAPGAVNLTNGDLARLEPGEYLNDTLIEFGLKHWLGELEIRNPELASQVHVFNSFFYKKLVHKKEPEQAFESLRKWTSKFDIFQKKYIIVPINENFHWYLAIIYEPEHVLIPTPEVPPKRKDTRSSIKHEISIVPAATEKDDDTTTSSITQEVPASDTTLVKQPVTPEDDSDDDMYATVSASEAEVELSLNNGFKSACFISDDMDGPAIRPFVEVAVADGDDDDDDVLSYASDKADISTNSNPAETPSSIMDENLDPGPSEVAMAVDDFEAANNVMKPDENDGLTALKLKAIPPTQFYGSTKAKGKQKALSNDNDEGDDVVVIDPTPTPKTYIFTLDSLGTRHPRAITKLATYLKLEARDKKGIPNASVAQGKMALVPTQPNFCDCGVYLIHFVRTFMTDPKRYCQSILTQKPTKFINKERQAEWHDDKVASMREDIATQIRELSEGWKRERRLKAAKETDDGDNKVNLVESSDSDIVVDDVNIVAPSPKKARAKRLRG